MPAKSLVVVASFIAMASAYAPPAAKGVRLHNRAHVMPTVNMIFGKGKVDYDLTDLGPMTKEKREVYKADRTPKTAYQPDDLAWDGSQLYLLTLPLLFVICLSLFGGVNLFGY